MQLTKDLSSELSGLAACVKILGEVCALAHRTACTHLSECIYLVEGAGQKVFTWKVVIPSCPFEDGKLGSLVYS